eukprot:3746095-Pleurochrysis_carterae.AAC.3
MTTKSVVETRTTYSSTPFMGACSNVVQMGTIRGRRRFAPMLYLLCVATISQRCRDRRWTATRAG